jgi:hypothetical protein
VSIQTIGGRREIAFDPEFDPKRASVLPCIASPNRISEALLESLQIADFSDLERKPTERLARKSSLETLNTLKRVWDGAAPLVDKQFRILVVGRGDHAVDPRYGGCELPEGARGKLLVVRRAYEEDPGEALKRGTRVPPRELQLQVFDSPGAVLRRIHHLGAGYVRELEALKEIHGRLKQVHGTLTPWSELDAGERREVRRKLALTVAHTLEQLQSALDYSKQRAAELIEKTTLSDSRSRDNPPRVQLLLMRSIEKIIDRLERARSKEGFVRIDERAVEGLMLESDHLLRDYGRQIAAAAPKLEQRHLLFSDRVTPAQVPVQRGGFIRSLGLDPQPLKRLEVSPYREFGAALGARYLELTAAITARDRAGAKDALVKMHVVAKLYLVAREVERMKIRIARDPETTFEGIRNAVAGALQLFDERDPRTGVVTTRLFADRHIPALDEPFNEVRSGLSAVLHEVEAAGLKKFGGQLSKEEEGERLTELRSALDRFGRGGSCDLIGALGRLP